jgi:hypothetical protein
LAIARKDGADAKSEAPNSKNQKKLNSIDGIGS